MPYKDITPPAGEKISHTQGQLTVPDRLVIPFIRGDGKGPVHDALAEGSAAC
jgi:isocitrate dehydrogenase